MCSNTVLAIIVAVCFGLCECCSDLSEITPCTHQLSTDQDNAISGLSGEQVTEQACNDLSKAFDDFRNCLTPLAQSDTDCADAAASYISSANTSQQFYNDRCEAAGFSMTTDAPKTELECIDYPSLKTWEGFESEGYIPEFQNGTIIGQSGVTIGSGVDLGSKNRRYFEDLNVPSEIIDKLEPYFGLKTEDAKAKLQEIQLTLTDEEARDLSEKVTIKMLKDLENNYNNAIDSGKKNWNELTNAQRTVITSVIFQYGSPIKTPNFWTYSTNQDWESVLAELRNFGDIYDDRREEEADLLEADDGTNSCEEGGGSGSGSAYWCPYFGLQW